MPVGNYSLSARVVDRQSLAVNSTPVNVVVGRPGPEALFVIGTVSIPTLNASDTAIQTRLERAGFIVKVVQAPSSATADAGGKTLIVVSSTVASGDVAAKFRSVPIPVVNWEQAIQDDFSMTGNGGTDHATIAGQLELEIVNPSHPLAAGLSGFVTIVNDLDTFSWGLPGDAAIKIAQIPGDPTKFPLYACEAGAAMFNGFAAPARRVMLPMGDASFEMFTEEGLKLFDAATETRPPFTARKQPHSFLDRKRNLTGGHPNYGPVDERTQSSQSANAADHRSGKVLSPASVALDPRRESLHTGTSQQSGRVSDSQLDCATPNPVCAVHRRSRKFASLFRNLVFEAILPPIANRELKRFRYVARRIYVIVHRNKR